MGIYTIPVLLLDTGQNKDLPSSAFCHLNFSRCSRPRAPRAAPGAKLALFPRAGREHRLEGI